MKEQTNNVELLDKIIQICRYSGEAIINIYQQKSDEIEIKNDAGYKSPITKADKKSHEIIQAELEKISDYPIISEEGAQNYQENGQFWLVDPLDGTKEFIGRNGEFTVNIGLIKNNKPILGVVYVPVSGVLYAAANETAFKINSDGKKIILKPEHFNGDVPKIVTSRNHKGEALAGLLEKFGPHEEVDVGSSLKFCLLAEGKAQVYPRLVPTYLWDTAAAHAILNFSGGEIRDLDGNTLNYKPEENIRNPLFVATAKGAQKYFNKFV